MDVNPIAQQLPRLVIHDEITELESQLVFVAKISNSLELAEVSVRRAEQSYAMRNLRWAVLALFTTLTVFVGYAAAGAPPPSATFYAMGVAPGGSAVRDAVKIGSQIRAVGGLGTQIGAATPRSSVLWTIDGVSPMVTTPLPDFSSGTAGTVASDISSNGLYIASQARSAAGPIATRVTVAGLATTNLNVAPYPVRGTPNFATAVSDNGQILYGQAPIATFSRSIRYDASAGTSFVIPTLPTHTSGNVPTARGASSDGSVMVGTSFNAPYGFTTNGKAFRFVNGSGLSAISTPGTWSKAIAISPDGNLTLVGGNSPAAPNGEVFIHNATANSLTSLGTPNSAMVPTSFGGMTADGGVVGISFSSDGSPVTGARYAFIHNAQGWFHVTTVLAATGIDLNAQNWNGLLITGVSSDGTLLFGTGLHNGAFEGFIVEFAPDFLNNFDVPATPPSDTRIVGAWILGDGTDPDAPILAFLADGSMYELEATVAATPGEAPGFERSRYTWDGSTGALSFAVRQDTNGDIGMSGLDGASGVTFTVNGDNAVISALGAGCVPDANDPCTYPAVRLTGSAGSIVGSYIGGDPLQDDSSILVVLLANGTFFLADDSPFDPQCADGIERGTYAWNAVTGDFNSSTTVDTNGQCGLSHPSGLPIVSLSADELVLTFTDNSGSTSFTRVVDPTTVTPAITSPLTASGVATTAFTYAVAATRATSYDATLLPAGLTIDTATGQITGTPTVSGAFDVTISATNTLASATATLHLTIDPPNTAPGSNVVVQPDLPSGAPPISIGFSTVTVPGETTVTPIPTGSQPPPPAGFSLGSPAVIYDVHTTAAFSGPVTLCFSYAGVNFGAGSPRLFHYEGGWVDITTSVDTVTQTICGTATSFSPFAIFVSPITRTGFYAPVTAAPGTFNTVKGGSTVPLKFNVTIDGVEQTTTSGLAFSVFSISCSSSAAEDQVDFTTTGNTSLRWAGDAFIQNWKTPTTPGCYLVRMTTVADGLSLTALFKVK